MKLPEQLAVAISIAVEAHKGQFDKGGKPYILHPLWVMNKVRHLGYPVMTAAVLHDVVEDSSVTIQDLKDLGIEPIILTALRLLTHKKGVEYTVYIEAIKQNPIARKVKIRDLEHNSKINRLKDIRPKDFVRLEKYFRAHKYLKE